MHQTEVFLMKQVEKYKGQVERVRKLHKPATISEGSIHTRYCSACCEPISDADDFIYYPCDTIKALDGEQ